MNKHCQSTESLNYNPKDLPRELCEHYIPASSQDIREMLDEINIKDLSELYTHIPEDISFDGKIDIPSSMDYDDLVKHMIEVASKNKLPEVSFIGDGLPHYKDMDIVPFVLGLRGLLTAYTPYQAERSQGTLASHWIFQNCLSKLTGFEAINASMYDRSTALFESLNVGVRLSKKGKNRCLLFSSIHPADLEVVETLAKETNLILEYVEMNPQSGVVELSSLKQKLEQFKEDLAVVAFPQSNCLGNLEPVDEITDLIAEHGVKSVAIFDPMMLGEGGLKPPSQFGEKGVDMIVGEGQHLCAAPNFGGPALGLFGMRFNDERKNDVRSAPGRFVGKAVDDAGNVSYALILSTREQHIRREKATSNICSNQAFMATLAGAAMMQRGETGMSEAARCATLNAHNAAIRLCAIDGLELAFPETPFFNEFALKLGDKSSQEIIEKACAKRLHIGVDVSHRVAGNNDNLLLLSFSDRLNCRQIGQMVDFFASIYGEVKSQNIESVPEIPDAFIREEEVGLPNTDLGALKKYYEGLEHQNISPDYSIYPLGSCTMKYNPYINEFAACLQGFTDIHPYAPVQDCQGSLEILYFLQEAFKKITGLAGVTTQPVAGAQGELVGIKLFQAYHRSKGELDRDIILIPRSAHGTNPATATVAGFETKKVKGLGKTGIILIEADEQGLMDVAQVESLVKEYGKRICGVMVTNPNTSGLFEVNFREIADKIHSVGGLVYLDGANMNAISGWVDLAKMGVDAVHNNLHKTWSIPHGGGGPGAGMVAVSEPLLSFLPGHQVIKSGDKYEFTKPEQSIGMFHRYYGNFANNVRCYTYLRRLGSEGVEQMSAVAVLAARYLYHKIKDNFQSLPKGADDLPRMHEFIITVSKEDFKKFGEAGVPHAKVAGRIGKVFLDFGFHAPTVSFPDPDGLMVEPTESYTKSELDRFGEAVLAIQKLIAEHPKVLVTAPHFTPVGTIDEREANRTVQFQEQNFVLPEVLPNRVHQHELRTKPVNQVVEMILAAHQKADKK